MSHSFPSLKCKEDPLQRVLPNPITLFLEQPMADDTTSGKAPEDGNEQLRRIEEANARYETNLAIRFCIFFFLFMIFLLACGGS